MRWLIVFCLAACVQASDLAGVWTGQIPQKNGDSQEIAFQFVQKGSELQGKLYGDYRSTPISRGVVSGDLLTFTLTLSEQNGNQINDTLLRFSGRMVNGALEITREREASTIAGNGGAVNLRGNSRQSFILKRLY